MALDHRNEVYLREQNGLIVLRGGPIWSRCGNFLPEDVTCFKAHTAIVKHFSSRDTDEGECWRGEVLYAGLPVVSLVRHDDAAHLTLLGGSVLVLEDRGTELGIYAGELGLPYEDRSENDLRLHHLGDGMLLVYEPDALPPPVPPYMPEPDPLNPYR